MVRVGEATGEADATCQDGGDAHRHTSNPSSTEFRAMLRGNRMIFERIRMTDARARRRQEVQTELAEWVEVEPRTWVRRVREWG